MVKAERNNRRANILLVVVSVVFFLFFGYQFWPIQVFDVPEPIPVLNENHQVKRGETLKLFFSRCKKVEATTTTTSSLVDGGFYTLRSGSVSNAPVGCTEPQEVTYIIPMDIKAGTYKLRGTAFSKLPLFKTVVETFHSEEFEIIE